MEVIVGALLRVEHAQEADDQQHDRAQAVHRIHAQQRARRCDSELAAHQHELDHDDRDERERCGVMQESEQSR